MKRKLGFLIAGMLFLFTQNILAQEQVVTGTVTDAKTGMPLPGVAVVEKGTDNGTITNFDGNYTLDVSADATLKFSFLGYSSKEVAVTGKSTIDVQLSVDTQALDQVVVTALGIKREQKSLGYSLQEVDAEILTRSKETNVANTLSGRVSGLQVVSGSSGPAGSSKIIIRGNSSLTGDNQPLIVVDGVPMHNFTGASNNDYWNPSLDMGSGIGDLNPQNIASISVLKGAAASALYGSRAGNGVILITTKTGKKTPGLGITYSATLGVETIFTGPDMQNAFGQGTNGIYNNESTLSWGPKITGQTVENWNGKQVELRAYDNIDSYFDTGISLNQSLSFSQQLNNTSLYSSISHLGDDSKIPGAKLKRTNLLTRAITSFGEDKRWTTDFKVQYIHTKAKNRPFSGVNTSNAFYTMYLLPRTVDVSDFSSGLNENGEYFWYIPASNQLNPYWGYRYNLNKDSRDRFMLNGSVKYQFTDWLTAEVQGGSDQYTTNKEAKVYAGSPLTKTGRYSIGKSTFMENNFSVLISASKDNVFGNFGLAGNLGGNLMHQKSSSLSGNAGELEVPNLFFLNNGINKPSISEGFMERKINSLYATFQLNYGGYWFLDITGRNDWSSTLSPENRSYFYPSITTSLVVTDFMEDLGSELPDWITYAKVRGSYAEVGNDLDPYQLYNTYNISKDPLGNTTASRNGVLYNPDVRSELIKAWEVGFAARFFESRIGIDVAWYKSNATRQLLNIPLNPLSGYNARKVNAGDIENRGLEVTFNATILDNPNGFTWETMVNYSHNRNIVNELTEDVEVYQLGGFDNISILAVAGEPYGEIYGTKFRRVQDESSPHYGEILLDESGLPMATSEQFRLGNQQADALLGWSNYFTYKNVTLSFLIDARFGGEIFSGTNLAMQRAGTAAATVVNGKREDFVVEGVIDVTPEDATTPVFEKNTNPVSHQQYWSAIGVGNLGIGEANIYDASNIRLRNVSLNYTLPDKWIKSLGLQKASVGLSANNVWMISSHMNGIDPESVYATGTNAVGFENASSPTSRSYFFNVQLSF